MKSWTSFFFGLAVGAVVVFIWSNRDTILFGIENRDKLSAAGDVYSGIKKLLS